VKRKPCLKARYRDHRRALEALRSLQKNSERETVPVRVYFCGRCSGYHMTSRKQLEAVEVNK